MKGESTRPDQESGSDTSDTAQAERTRRLSPTTHTNHVDALKKLYGNRAATRVHQSWTAPLEPEIDAEIRGREFGCAHSEVFLIASDAVSFIEPSEHVSDPECLVHVFDACVTPESRSWPVYGLPVGIALGSESMGLERRFVEVLKTFQPTRIVTYLYSAGVWHGGYEYQVTAPNEVAA